MVIISKIIFNSSYCSKLEARHHRISMASKLSIRWKFWSSTQIFEILSVLNKKLFSIKLLLNLEVSFVIIHALKNSSCMLVDHGSKMTQSSFSVSKLLTANNVLRCWFLTIHSNWVPRVVLWLWSVRIGLICYVRTISVLILLCFRTEI